MTGAKRAVCNGRGVDEEMVRTLLSDVQRGTRPIDEAVGLLRRLPFADLGFARIDHHRSLRQGRPETIYAPGKAPEQVAAIVATLLTEGAGPVLLSRADNDQVAAAIDVDAKATVTETSSGALVAWRPRRHRRDRVAIVTAGTADRLVADEAQGVLTAYGITAERHDDVGVAGIHRVLAVADQLAGVHATIVAAGMEGALASVVGGLVPGPVVAVPTSVGYGASLEGVTALLAMLSSCAAGVSVVGIDNGFGAAMAVLRVLDAPTTPPTGHG